MQVLIHFSLKLCIYVYNFFFLFRCIIFHIIAQVFSFSCFFFLYINFNYLLLHIQTANRVHLLFHYLNSYIFFAFNVYINIFSQMCIKPFYIKMEHFFSSNSIWFFMYIELYLCEFYRNGDNANIIFFSSSFFITFKVYIFLTHATCMYLYVYILLQLYIKRFFHERMAYTVIFYYKYIIYKLLRQTICFVTYV